MFSCVRETEPTINEQTYVLMTIYRTCSASVCRKLLDFACCQWETARTATRYQLHNKPENVHCIFKPVLHISKTVPGWNVAETRACDITIGRDLGAGASIRRSLNSSFRRTFFSFYKIFPLHLLKFVRPYLRIAPSGYRDLRLCQAVTSCSINDTNSRLYNLQLRRMNATLVKNKQLLTSNRLASFAHTRYVQCTKSRNAMTSKICYAAWNVPNKVICLIRLTFHNLR